MKSKIIFHFFIFLFGFFVGNLFPTFFGHIVGSVTSFFLLLLLEGFNFIGTKPKPIGGMGARSKPVSALPLLDRAIAKLTPTFPQADNKIKNLGEMLFLKTSPGKGVAEACGKGSWGEALPPPVAPPQALQSITRPKGPMLFSNFLVSVFNSLKIGILFGLFVDAFKVGS